MRARLLGTMVGDGPETAHLRQRVPRVVQMAITNHCDLACAFCYRPPDDPRPGSPP